jgi:hypothetical protein
MLLLPWKGFTVPRDAFFQLLVYHYHLSSDSSLFIAWFIFVVALLASIDVKSWLCQLDYWHYSDSTENLIVLFVCLPEWFNECLLLHKNQLSLLLLERVECCRIPLLSTFHFKLSFFYSFYFISLHSRLTFIHRCKILLMPQ